MANVAEQGQLKQGGGTLPVAAEQGLLSDEQWRIVRQKYRMTPREIEIARLICRGLSNEEIASVVQIRYGTVKTHIRNIYRRVHVKSKVSMLLRFIDDSKTATRRL
jgi:DNA-binding NarL/FixJ family response regulator